MILCFDISGMLILINFEWNRNYFFLCIKRMSLLNEKIIRDSEKLSTVNQKFVIKLTQ